MNDEAKKPEEQTQVPEKKEAQDSKKKKKLNKLTLKEIEKMIQVVQEKMGGLNSFYAKELVRRKEQLLQADSSEQGKAENNPT